MQFQVSADSVLWDVLDDEAVVIHVDSSEYFALNEAGTGLWLQMVEGPRSEDDLTGALVAAGRPESEAAREAGDYVQALVAAELVTTTEAGSGGGDAPATPTRRSTPPATGAPSVSKLGELETLLLSGE